MAKTRKQFLDMMADKVMRASSMRAVNDIIDECGPKAEIIIRCPDGHTYEWTQDGESILESYEDSDGMAVFSAMTLDGFSDLREFAAQHIRCIR